MKALTVCEPCAELIIEGAVYVEATLDEVRWARRHAPHFLRRIGGVWWLLA